MEEEIGQVEEVKLTPKQIRFCEEYIIDLNATQAYVRAGYSSKGARQSAHRLLTNADIKACIANFVKQHTLGGDEAVKIIGDIAKSNLNEYFVIKEVERIPTIKVPLIKHIEALEKEIAFEDEYAVLAEFDKKERQFFDAAQKNRKRQLIRMKLELKHNPDATRNEQGEPYTEEVAELDLVSLVKDKETGRIKSFKYTKDGPHVELYNADSAARDIAKITGKLVEKQQHELTGKDGKDLIPDTKQVIIINGKEIEF